MKYSWVILVFFFGINGGKAQYTEFFSAADTFLKTHVENGKVDYASIVKQPLALNNVLKLAEKAAIDLQDPNVYQAFWINTYNLLVIKGVVDNYPLRSPLDVDGFFDKLRYNVGGRYITLNAIENELLRARFPNEPRFHFVLVCAGLGCPPIIGEAYMPNRLNQQLHQQTAKALNDPMFIRNKGDKVFVSQLFDWYKVDFDRAGGILAFINRYRTTKFSKDILLDYYPYDWRLNVK
ncbi:DUF547 domain-containing protein [Maribacter sp. MAR_2009_72]|uniref:DUF547 domain-containing protein n=1 Tax=Maribacter sp. MAR_2009_72 TaxID=1250050 RepID=UPI00119914C8|nr:DUF547 domain-containing protein [Maribacter sp. MAR_2009_72]TVZ15585.1 uncharacterized protein DUF547 [Maribacter sp. MAR_2009_72]